MTRLNVSFSDEAYKTLTEISKETNQSKAEVLRTALALLKVAYDEERKGWVVGAFDSKSNEYQRFILPK